MADLVDTDKVKAGLRAIIRSVFPRVDYYALYPAKVIAQAADGSLDVVPDDRRLASLQGVPVRYGVPGIAAAVAAGARVLLGFAGGDPSKPIVELWESASVTQITVTAASVKLGGGSGTDAVALYTALKTAFDAHIHAGVQSGGASSGPPASPLPAGVGSSVVQAKT